jgi:hypothetical protein
MPEAFSPENPLIPASPGWNTSTILPFARRQQPAEPVTGTDESGRSQQFVAPRTGWSLPGILQASMNELTSAVTLPGRAVQGQVLPGNLPREAISASLALMGAGVGAEAGGLRALGAKQHILEPVEHDPFAGTPVAPKLFPVDHDPFALEATVATNARVFTPEELARGRETPVSLTPASGQPGAAVQARGINVGDSLPLIRDTAQRLGAQAASKRKMLQPSKVALEARKMAEENMKK